MKSVVNSVKNKLSNNSGVTILFALLLFLVVSMVSVTILAASYSSVKRTNSSKEALQSNIDLDSAILLLNKEINNVEYTITATTRKGSTSYSAGSLSKSNSVFANEITKISDQYIKNPNVSSCSIDDFTISASNLEDVKVSTSCKLGTSGQENSVTFTLKNNESVVYVTYSISDTASSNGNNAVKHTVKWTYDKSSGKKSDNE